MGCASCALRDSVAAYRRPGGGVTVVYSDPIPDNPRDDDCLGLLVFDDRRLRGDRVDDHTRSAEGLREIVAEGGLVFPVLVYDHSGLAFRLVDGNAGGGPASDLWDTRCPGVMVTTADAMRRCFGAGEITEDIRARAVACLRGELRVYEDYCNGSVYGFRNYDADWNETDACWGFYGFDHKESGLFEAAGLPDAPQEYDAKPRAA